MITKILSRDANVGGSRRVVRVAPVSFSVASGSERQSARNLAAGHRAPSTARRRRTAPSAASPCRHGPRSPSRTRSRAGSTADAPDPCQAAWAVPRPRARSRAREDPFRARRRPSSRPPPRGRSRRDLDRGHLSASAASCGPIPG
jgi:hypothetical protein